MKTGLTKRQKTTAIFFDEYSNMIEVQTHNTDLKKRLSAFAAKHPQCCRQTDDDEQGGLTFEIEKGRLSFRLTAPYSEERRRKASSYTTCSTSKASTGWGATMRKSKTSGGFSLKRKASTS